ncbi:MAG: phosphate ABC transporter permease PtsA, partial [Methyloceanibacter sp.]
MAPGRNARYSRRRASNVMATVLSIGAAFFGLAWLALILTVLVVKGVGGLTLAVFTEMTPPPGGAGGLLNPIVGSLILT